MVFLLGNRRQKSRAESPPAPQTKPDSPSGAMHQHWPVSGRQPQTGRGEKRESDTPAALDRPPAPFPSCAETTGCGTAHKRPDATARPACPVPAPASCAAQPNHADPSLFKKIKQIGTELHRAVQFHRLIGTILIPARHCRAGQDNRRVNPHRIGGHGSQAARRLARPVRRVARSPVII